MSGYRELQTPLNDEEIEELDEFLMSDVTGENPMDVSELHGFLTAVITGPLVMPSEWLPLVWGGEATFESLDQVNRATSLVMRLSNEIAVWLAEDPQTFEPLFYENKVTTPPTTVAESWCYGYMRGIALRVEEWQWVFDDPQVRKFLIPISIFGHVDDPATKRILKDETAFAELTQAVTPCALNLYKRWKERQINASAATQRKTPKHPPNAPCPCGSGKKYKRCCGSPIRAL